MDRELELVLQAAQWALTAGESQPIGAAVRVYDQNNWDCGTSCCIWGARCLLAGEGPARCGPPNSWAITPLHWGVLGLLRSECSTPEQMIDLLRLANLRGADLGWADLREANLGEADLRQADLRGADLREADLREADLGWANLRGADLRGANLREADLGWANLREADLGGADLREADLRQAKGL